MIIMTYGINWLICLYHDFHACIIPSRVSRDNNYNDRISGKIDDNRYFNGNYNFNEDAGEKGSIKTITIMTITVTIMVHQFNENDNDYD